MCLYIFYSNGCQPLGIATYDKPFSNELRENNSNPDLIYFHTNSGLLHQQGLDITHSSDIILVVKVVYFVIL